MFLVPNPRIRPLPPEIGHGYNEIFLYYGVTITTTIKKGKFNTHYGLQGHNQQLGTPIRVGKSIDLPF